MNATSERLTAALADRYRIERELGQGGMATVYLAEDLKHKRKVAVKVLRPDLAAALGTERFLREIETTASLRHPHILPLYDSGEAAGFLFYVMPLVEGESLRDRLSREKQLPLDDALQIAREVSDALSYAHSRGVIHRDIKPENILLESGHAMVADFGIAKAVSAAGTESLTQVGMALGTAAYMSPEQAAGERDVDGRSDLYSLGCVVYEMLAGQAPFTGPTVESIVHQHLVADVRPITQLRPAVPDAIAGVLLRALAKNPADRFSPVAQFADALRVGQTVQVPARSRTRTRTWITVGTAAMLLIVTGVFGVRALGDRPSVPAADTEIPSVAVLPFSDLSGGANEYLGDGMAETLINALSGVSGLRVAARTSAFSFKGKSQDVRSIGQALNVESVLEGSVQRAGDRLRITAHLVNARDGFDLWSQSFDRKADDVFAVQDEVARAVVAALEVRLVANRGAPSFDQGTKSLAAYNAYLQGLFFWNKRTRADVERSAGYFVQAIEADSAFARAWAGLANAYALFPPMHYDVLSIPPRQALERAERAARRALQLNDRVAEAHAALGQVLVQRGLLDESEESFRRAIAVDPKYPTAHQWYAGALTSKGQVKEALEQALIAQSLDPLSLVIGVEVGEYLDAMGRRAEATAQYDRVLERYPDTYLTNWFVGLHLLVDRDWVRSPALVGRLVVDLGADSATGRRITAGLRDSTTRRATLRALADSAMASSPPIALASLVALGDIEGAITAFDRIVDGPQFARIYLGDVLAVLGPEVSARPRVQAARSRFLVRLRTLYQ